MHAKRDSIAYFRGQFLSLDKCLVPIDLHALQYGTACFEGIRGYWDPNKQQVSILFLREHFERLHRNGAMLFMKSPGVEEMCRIAVELIRQNNVDYNIYLRPVLHKDCTDLGPRLANLPDGYFCYTLPLGDYLDTSKGLQVSVTSWTRLSDNQIPTRAKATGGYINSALAKTEALSNGFDEAIFLNQHGYVTEGSAENIFLVRDGVLVTPDLSSDILEGITRKAVLTLAKDLGIPTLERQVARTELYRADEIFLCGTGCQISWVKSVDRRPVGEGLRGPITTKIQQTYEDAVYGRNAKYSSWLTPVPRT